MDRAETKAREKGAKNEWTEDKIQSRATKRRNAKAFFLEVLPKILLTNLPDLLAKKRSK